MYTLIQISMTQLYETLYQNTKALTQLQIVFNAITTYGSHQPYGRNPT
jgi:hypothetical protein